MATRLVLSELANAYAARSGVAVHIESVGGVDAAKRVAAGEAFDAVFLSAEAIDKLIAAGHAIGPRVDLMNSGIAVAVRAGAPRPDISSADAVREAVLKARTIGYSTGPSGVALAKLFERWGIAEQIATRIVTPPPGIAVGSLVAKGEVELGFQQGSELIHVEGIAVIGPLPADIQVTTTFSAAVCAASSQRDDVRELLAYLASAEALPAKLKEGMEPV